MKNTKPRTLTLKKNTLFVSELKTKFRVIKLHWEPHAESEWHLRYKNFPVFDAVDKVGATKEEDEHLVGKEIEAHIDITTEKEQMATKKEKFFSCKKGWATVTGVVEGKIRYCLKQDDGSKYEEITYKLNSIFPLEISDLPQDAKIGDWVTVSGEASINLPEKR